MGNNKKEYKQTEIGKIPEDWEVVKIRNMRDEIKFNKVPEEIYPYIEIGDIDIESKIVKFKQKGGR